MASYYDLNKFLGQLRRMRELGSISEIVKKIPGMSAAMANSDVDERDIVHFEAIIHSMTREERRHPEFIGQSERERIARGSGTCTADVTELLKSFAQVRDMMAILDRMNRKPGGSGE